jgi:hypothetical protein
MSQKFQENRVSLDYCSCRVLTPPLRMHTARKTHAPRQKQGVPVLAPRPRNGGQERASSGAASARIAPAERGGNLDLNVFTVLGRKEAVRWCSNLGRAADVVNEPWQP